MVHNTRATGLWRLRVALAAAGAAIAIALGFAGASHGAGGAPVFTTLSLPTNDLAFDPGSNRLYASVPGRAGALGNHVVAINPATGAIEGSVFVGSEPSKLALSQDGQYLYVGLNGAAAVRRVSLPSLTAGLQFSLGADSFFGPYLAEDIEVLPSDPGAVAISRINSGISPRHAGVVIYDEGVKLDTETPRHTGSNRIEFGSLPGRLYGYNNETTEFGFRRMSVGSTGVTTLDVTQNLISNFGIDIEFDGGRVYATSGRVVDPESRTLLGTYPIGSAGPVEPDSANGKVYFISSGTLREFGQTTFALLRSFPISGMTGTPSSLVNIGGSDLAFRTSGDQVFLVHFSSEPDTTPPTLGLSGDFTVDATGPGGTLVGYYATAVDDVDGPVPVSCSPASGATFPMGTTTVACTALDAAGNEAAGTFSVTVRGALEQIAVLQAEVALLPAPKLRGALDTKLQAAATMISNRRPARACTKLNAFIAQVGVNSGGKIPANTADKWIADATRIRAAIAC